MVYKHQSARWCSQEVKDKGFDEDVEKILLETVKGTIDLIDAKQISFNDIVPRVATKGGITMEGVKIINERMPEVFEQIIQSTMAKRNILKTTISQAIQEK